jgi:hypothetical protein
MVKSTIRKVGSLFFLGIFLWFYSVKDIHDVIHANDIHQHYQNAENFQTPEHHCPICDFEFPGFDDQKPQVKVPANNFSIKVENAVLPKVVSFEVFRLFSSRAPPVVA